jgi:hypothetical protein
MNISNQNTPMVRSGEKTAVTMMPGANPHERNDHYHRKALDNIRSRAEKLGVTDIADTEDDMKELVAHVLGVDDDRAEVIYEIMERVCSCHYRKINP